MSNKELYQALVIAHRDATEQAERHSFLGREKALYGWSQERHVKYHEDHAMLALAAARFLHLRIMQIDPD